MERRVAVAEADLGLIRGVIEEITVRLHATKGRAEAMRVTHLNVRAPTGTCAPTTGTARGKKAGECKTGSPRAQKSSKGESKNTMMPQNSFWQQSWKIPGIFKRRTCDHTATLAFGERREGATLQHVFCCS